MSRLLASLRSAIMVKGLSDMQLYTLYIVHVYASSLSCLEAEHQIKS